MLEAGWPAGCARRARGRQPLHWAGFHGNAEMARVLLRHSPPLELEDLHFHGRPLGWAMHGSIHGWHRERGDYAATVEAMLDAGASPPKADALEASDAVIDVLKRRGLLT